MAEQPAGTELNATVIGTVQRSQKIEIVGVGAPLQLPGFTVHVEPKVAEPDTVGATVLAGDNS
jgi:hypothetical protein